MAVALPGREMGTGTIYDIRYSGLAPKDRYPVEHWCARRSCVNPGVKVHSGRRAAAGRFLACQMEQVCG